MRKHGGTPSRHDKYVTLAAISTSGVAPGSSVGATSQVWRDVSRLPSSSTEPLPVRHSGNNSRNHGALLHLHLPTYLPPSLGVLQQRPSNVLSQRSEPIRKRQTQVMLMTCS